MLSEEQGVETSQGLLADVVRMLRALGTDTRHVEVKAAGGGVPRALAETISSFSNSAGGGLIILGLNETQDFQPVQDFNAHAIADGVSDLVRQRRSHEAPGKLSPAPLAEVALAPFEESTLVLIEVAEMPAHSKPCHITAAGPAGGSYYRLHDGDHRYSEYDVFSLLSNRNQPVEDAQPVERASFADLDPDAVTEYLDQLRSAQPGLFRKLDQTGILSRTQVLDADGTHPTVAGLLTLGIYPQQFFPQFMITFAEFPGTRKGETLSGVKLLNRAYIDGPIPVMIDSAVSAVQQSLKVRRVVRGSRVEEVPEISPETLREAIANAVMHRDYSNYAQGQQVRIELFSDRLVISNPGGLHGGLTKADIWKGQSSSRNAVLARVLPRIPLPGSAGRVAENLGTGIQTMVRGQHEMGLDAPIVKASVAHFELTLPRYGLVSEEVLHWLSELGATELPIDAQRILAVKHAGESLTVKNIRRLLSMDGEDIRDVLGFLTQQGWLSYPQARGDAYPDGPRLTQLPGMPLPGSPSRDEGAKTRVQRCFEDGSPLTSRHIEALTGLHINTVRKLLGQLVDEGWLDGIGPATSRSRTYRKK